MERLVLEEVALSIVIRQDRMWSHGDGTGFYTRHRVHLVAAQGIVPVCRSATSSVILDEKFKARKTGTEIVQKLAKLAKDLC